MNEPRDTDETAALLDRFRPAAAPPDLMLRLLAARPGMPVVTRKPRISIFLPRFAAAAVVMLAGGTAVWQMVPGTSRQEISAVPAINPAVITAGVSPGAPRESRQQLLGIRDLGISRDSHSRPVRLMHTTWLEDDVPNGGDGNGPAREARVHDEIVPVLLTTY